jgi:hypothetical protein
MFAVSSYSGMAADLRELIEFVHMLIFFTACVYLLLVALLVYARKRLIVRVGRIEAALFQKSPEALEEMRQLPRRFLSTRLRYCAELPLVLLSRLLCICAVLPRSSSSRLRCERCAEGPPETHMMYYRQAGYLRLLLVLQKQAEHNGITSWHCEHNGIPKKLSILPHLVDTLDGIVLKVADCHAHAMPATPALTLHGT